jgi:hypothetical protein
MEEGKYQDSGIKSEELRIYRVLVVSMQFPVLINTGFRVYTETVSDKYSHDSQVLQQKSAAK